MAFPRFLASSVRFLQTEHDQPLSHVAPGGQRLWCVLLLELLGEAAVEAADTTFYFYEKRIERLFDGHLGRSDFVHGLHLLEGILTPIRLD